MSILVRRATAVLLLGAVAAVARQQDTISGNYDDLSLLYGCDTLEVFAGGRPVGAMISCFEPDDRGRMARRSRLEITNAKLTGGEMTLVERRWYDSRGRLIEAHQEMISVQGTTAWRAKKEQGGWVLAVETGGEVSRHPLTDVRENLDVTVEIMRGIRSGTLRTGRKWTDYQFDLTSGTSIQTTTTCVGTPNQDPGGLWEFEQWIALSGQTGRWKADTLGRVVYEEIPPMFVARRKGTKAGKEGKKSGAGDFVSLEEFGSVRVGRRAKRDETPVISLSEGARLHESVRTFYEGGSREWKLKPLACACPIKGAALSEQRRRELLSPTVTIQSGNDRITALAARLAGKTRDRCALIRRFTHYVDTSIENRHTTTFSTALQTLQAGYGDCGEHAVLLAALLRASRIPARVVYGLVYVPAKKAWLYHVWVMAFAGGWIFADPSHGDFPACRDRLPLVIDDTGEQIVFLSSMIERVDITYVPGD